MKLAIMQPYFLPYIGYFQLINAVDIFVVYDNIQYTKRGWINRNRFLQNGTDSYFTIPLQRGSDFFDIFSRKVTEDFDKCKLKSQIYNAYIKAPYFHQIFPVFENIIDFEDKNLFNFIYFSLKKICSVLEINTELVISSSLPVNHLLKSHDKVLSICKELKAGEYINAIGGQELYSQEQFQNENIKLSFIQSKPIEYKQFKNEFVPYLSILDVMMFNSPEEINAMLDKFELV